MRYLSFILLGFLYLNAMTLSAQCYNPSATENAWLSCEKTQGPNLERGAGHWIHYDLGEVYQLGEIHFWNFNEEGLTSQGIAEIAIDYSDDGINWTAWGNAAIAEATGLFVDEGTNGPNLENLATRHLLITVLATHGNGDCAGFSEIKMDVSTDSETAIEIVENGDNLELTVSPNPVPNVLMVQSNKSIDSWIITDLMGKTLLVGKETTNQLLEVDVNKLATGHYFLSIQTENEGRQTVKFVKK